MSLAELKFKLSTDVGDPTKLWAEITAQGPHGAIGPDGLSAARGFPKGYFDAAGNLKARDGGPYLLNSTDVEGVAYRLTVKRGSTSVVDSVTFAPVLVNGVIDVLSIIRDGKGQVASPAQLASLSVMLTRGEQQQAAVADGLAEIAQSTTLLEQAAGVGRVATEADLTGQPGTPEKPVAYEITSTNERVLWDGTQIVPGSRGPMLATALDAEGIKNVLQYSRASLVTGNASPLADAVRIWDEYGSLKVRQAKAGEQVDNGLLYALAGGRVAERENIERRNIAMFDNEKYLRAAMISANLAIQKAVASLPAEGGRLYFPNGAYLIDRDGIELMNKLGILIECESRYGVRFVNGVVDGHMFRVHDCQMFGIENAEFFQQQQKTFGAYLDIQQSNLVHMSRVRMQSPYRGIQIDGVTQAGGVHLNDIKFLPQNADWAWNAAIHIQRTGGVFAHGVDVNFGQCPIQNAGIVLDGGCDTIYFVNSGANQIGGTPGGPRGATALKLENTNSSFDPRWVRFTNSAFESAGLPSVVINAGNDVQFIGAYSVNARNALLVTGGANIKWLGGVMAATSEHVVEILGGRDIVIDNATIASGSWAADNAYSGVHIGPDADRVRVTGCNIGDNTTIPEHAGKMAYGVSIDGTNADRRHVIRDNTYGVQCNERVFNGSPTSTVLTRRETEGRAAPTIGKWEVGDRVRNTATTVAGGAGGQYVVTGWRCIFPGTPGEWVEERVLTGN